MHRQRVTNARTRCLIMRDLERAAQAFNASTRLQKLPTVRADIEYRPDRRGQSLYKTYCNITNKKAGFPIC